MLNKPVLIITFVVLILCTLPLSGEDYTLGVLYLETETGESAPLKESDLQALTLALSEMMISDLSSLQILTLVEREEINRIIEEQKLALSGMIEKSSAARVGKLLGARFLLTGRVVFTDRLVTLSCRISNVESGAVVSSATVNGTVENLFILQEALLEKLLTQWDIPLSRSEWDQLAERSNVSLNGLIRFGNALYASDKGDYEEALRYFEEALEISPGFRLAKESLEAIKKRFDDFLSHREMDLPAEIMEAIDRTAAKEPGADQEMQKMYWAYLQPMMLALSYYGSWAALPEESREWFFAETIQPSWAQMGLPSKPESMQEMAEYLGRRIYICKSAYNF